MSLEAARTALSWLRPRDAPPHLSFAAVAAEVDAWPASAADLNLLLRPILGHAGLGHLDVYVELFLGLTCLHGLAGSSPRRPAHAPSVWWDQTLLGLCVFQAEASALVDPECVIADAARAVADVAWATTGAACEKPPPDILACALGLGALAVSRPLSMSDTELLAVAESTAGPTVPRQLLLDALSPAVRARFSTSS